MRGIGGVTQLNCPSCCRDFGAPDFNGDASALSVACRICRLLHVISILPRIGSLINFMSTFGVGGPAQSLNSLNVLL